MVWVNRWILVVLLGVAGAFIGPTVGAETDCHEGTPPLCSSSKNGDNESDGSQGNEITGGDAIAAQVVGLASEGNTKVGATNNSRDVSAKSGAIKSSNSAGGSGGDAITGTAVDGDDAPDIAQAAQATSGDGVGGQVIGVLTASGGRADLVVDNTVKHITAISGDNVGQGSADIDV